MKGSLGKMMEKIKTKKKKTVLAGIGLVVCCAIAGVLIAQNEKPETVILKSDQAVLTVSEGTSQEVEKNLKDLSIDYSTVGKNQYVVNTKDTKKIQKSLNSIKGAEATFAEDQPFLLMGNQKDAKESKKKTDKKEIDKEETVDINDIGLEEDLPEGKTWRELADERNQKLVAVIDSQVDHYAIHTENFTDMDEGVLQNHGTLVGRTIYQEAGDKAMILGLKAFAENGTGYMSDVMEAVEYARQQKVDIINLSFTTDKINEVKPLETLLQQCMDEGIQVVVAAGNFDQDIKYFSPANIDGVISVGALDEDGKRAAFSNYGDVTFYVKSPSTSQAAALVSGMLARGDDMKDVKTGDDIQVKEEENKEHLDIFENNEQGDFVTQSSNQNIQLSSGYRVSWCMSGITAETITGPAWFEDGTWNLGFYAQGGYWVYAVTFEDAQAKNGYAIDSFTLSGSINYGSYTAQNGYINRRTIFVPGFTATTVLTANTHQVAKQEHKVHYDLNGGSWNTSAITNPNGYKIIEDGNYQIQWGYNSSYYIHTKSNNAQALGIHLWNDSTDANSIWYFERYQNTPYYFIVGDNGWDLASYGTERVDEANQVNDGSRNNHLWAIEEMSNGNIALKNVGTGRYIYSHYATVGNGNSIGLWGNHDATDCQWKLVKKYTGTSAYRKKLYGNTFYVNQKAPVKPGYIFNGWASRPEWETREKSVSINGRTFDRYFIQPIGGNRFEVMVHTTDSRITQVSVPIWSDANGQDDLQWPTLGKGTWTRDGQSFNWGAQITIPEEISHYSMHIYTGINGAWEEASGSSGLDSVWTIGEQYTFDTNTDGTMYATWRKDDTQYQQTVNVRFENADGSFTSYQQAYQQTVKAGETFTWKYPESSIYQSASISEKVTGTKTHTVTVYRKKYTATFDSNGGSTPSTKTLTRRAQQPLGTLPTVTRSNYTFLGWYTAKTGGTKISTSTTMPTQNTTYYAQWKANTYTITYKANGGSGADQTQSVQYGTAWTTKGAIFTKTGYTLSSWNTKADGSGTKYSLNAKQTDKQSSNLTLYAQWSPITYIVRYHANGGTGTMKDQTLTYDKKEALSPNAFTGPDNQAWVGWNTKADGTGKSVMSTSDDPVALNLASKQDQVIDLYAQWGEIAGRIDYELNGGIDPGNPTSYSTTTKGFTLMAPTKTGYTFTGWTGSNGTTPQQTVTIKTGTTGNLFYEAHWKANTYTLVYNRNGSTSGSMSKQTLTYDKEHTLTKNAFVKNGYVFAGWNTKADGSGTKYNDADKVKNLANEQGSTVTLYAQWTKKIVTLTFDGNGGSDGGTIEKQSTLPIGTLPTSSRSGYTFLGWYTSKSGGTKITEKTVVPNQNTTYYAHWKGEGFDITYDLDGGKVSGNPDSYTPESATITLKNPTKTGHTFLGWTGTGLNGLTKNVTIPKGSTGDRHYTANWKAHTYTIRYNGNGSTSGSTATSTHTYGVAKNLTENGFRRTGYTFAGWNTKADGSGTSYKNAQSVKNLTSSDGTVVNLYARWYVNTYTVTFNPNMDASSNTVTIFAGTRDETLHRADGSSYTDKSGGTRTKYVLTFNKADHEKGLLSVTIKGLYGALDGTIRKVESTKTSIVDFDPAIATKVISFDPNGGTCEIESARFTVNSKLSSLPTPQREGYTFDGWFTSPDGGTRVTTSTPLGDEDRTVYAHWTAKTYTITYHGNNGSYNGKETYEDTVQWGVDYEASTNFFTRSGWKFRGWNTKADGTGKDWTGKINQTEAWHVDSDVTLYAQWSK